MATTAISKIMKEAVFKMHHLLDKEFFNRSQEAAMRCGAVVNSCFVIGDLLYCANMGDCRSVLSRNGKAVNLSVDHKSTRRSEMNRVKQLGGYVSHGRVFGRLMISRAFGDFELKIKRDMQMNV